MNIQDAVEMKSGDLIALFVGNFNPPTMEHVRTVEALKLRPEIKHVWVCPLSGDNDEHVRAMSAALCNDFLSGQVDISYATIALDKKMKNPEEALTWVREKFGYLKFVLATVSPEPGIDTEKYYQSFFGLNAGATPSGVIPMILDKFLPAPSDLLARIKSGSDESRNFIPAIWNYIQKHKLYR